MVNYAEAIERELEEFQRRASILRSELEEIDSAAVTRQQELAERLAMEFEQSAEEDAARRAEAEEQERREVEERAERFRAEEEAREQREAIARSVAARRAKDVVVPLDEDDDPEGEYYRRKSWLV